MMMGQHIPKGQGKAMKWLRDHVSHADDACLPWPFARIKQKGYGRLGHNGQNLYAHRVMCELVHGPAPADRPQATHSCGKGHEGCVNPRHLSWASNTENQLDRRKHGTQRGAVDRKTRVPRDIVARIRALKGRMTQAEIARIVGVKVGTVEYWHKNDHEPAPPGTSRSAHYRRAQRASRLT